MTQRAKQEASSLILAAEECPSETFSEIHSFSEHDDMLIRKLSAHGPVLLRGGRGSGKSALMMETRQRLSNTSNVLPIYVSLRYLPLLRSEGDEYIKHFGALLSQVIRKELQKLSLDHDFPDVFDEISIRDALSALSQETGRRIVILFDDAAHIGREKPLEAFFDLFRTLSSGAVSCKASIYPGVTKFGIRFDVFNDATVIDINRSDTAKDSHYFLAILQKRYPDLARPEIFSEGLTPQVFSQLIARAVVGNMRAFVLACNRFNEELKISIPVVNRAMLAMATEYYWPLMEEVAPKLGEYEPLLDTSRDIFEAIVAVSVKPANSGLKSIAQERILIHRQHISRFSKAFEILEYLGFLIKREASRGMKSGGRGPVYALNLCNLLDQMPTGRLTIEGIRDWISDRSDIGEIHSSAATFGHIELPDLLEAQDLKIFKKNIDCLKKSRAYPYGLTDDKIERLSAAGYETVEQLASATDEELDEIFKIGRKTIERIRDNVYQAIWM